MAAPPTTAEDHMEAMMTLMNEDSERGRVNREYWIRSSYGNMLKQYEKLFNQYVKELKTKSVEKDATRTLLLDLIEKYTADPSADDPTPLVTEGTGTLFREFIDERLRFLEKKKSDEYNLPWLQSELSDGNDAFLPLKTFYS